MKNEIKILIADDHPVLRKGMKNILTKTPGHFSVDEAENGEQALAMLKKQFYDVAVFDIDMPLMNGLEAAAISKKLNIETKIIILTMYKDEHLFNQAVDAGVMGYVLKDNVVSEIRNALWSVLEGHHYICPAMSEYLMKRERKIIEKQNEQATIGRLTPTEIKILKLISESKTSKEIAGQLYVSTKTVEKHRMNICNKLDIHGTHALIKYAFEHKDEL
jgi:two-component system response regulator DegU